MTFKNIALVYEISNNPYFADISVDRESPFAELVKPYEINRLKKALNNLKYVILEFDGPFDFLNSISRLKKKKNLVVFSKCRGISGLERKVFMPTICTMFKIPFIGTSSYAITLARHKYHTNRLLSGLGFNVPMASICYPGQLQNPKIDTFPVIVKPNHESGALGISEDSIAYSDQQVKELVGDLHKRYNQPCIIENFVSGEEWRISVIGNHPDARAIGCAGVLKNGKLIIGSLQTRSDLLCGRIDYYFPDESNLLGEAMQTAVKIHTALGCKDYSRIDFRVSKENELVCMEVSTYPDISEDSSFIYAAMQSFTTYEEVIQSIINSCQMRYSHPRLPGSRLPGSDQAVSPGRLPGSDQANQL
jgi:D-alanine-D-alanine ligase